MKVSFDRDVDVLRVIFSSRQIEESDEEKPGFIIDYDADGNIVGLELLRASQTADISRLWAEHIPVVPRRVARKRVRKVPELPADLKRALKKIPSGYKIIHSPSGKSRLVKIRAKAAA